VLFLFLHECQILILGTVQFRLDEDTAYSVEELLGMILAHAKQQAEDFTQQKIKVIIYTNVNQCSEYLICLKLKVPVVPVFRSRSRFF
jgi:hypothetical protein